MRNVFIDIRCVCILCAALMVVSIGFAFEPKNDLDGPYRVTEVTDGDTITLRGVGKVRLIGIDTPEKRLNDHLERTAEKWGLTPETVQEFGKAASAFTKDLIHRKDVWVELDVQERDPYRRVLAYIYLPDDEGLWEYQGERYTQVNHAILLAGWAEPYTFPPNVAYVTLFRETVDEAKALSNGMWAELQSDVRIECITYNPKGRDEGEEFITLKSVADIDVTDWVVKDRQENQIILEGEMEKGYLYDFFVARNQSMWGNGGDTAYLYNTDGVLMDEFRYEGIDGAVEACR